MDMMINANTIKAFRHQKSWSQEKLSALSGVSLRTIQRVEKEGSCSLETKLSLAAVFNVEPELLSQPVRESQQTGTSLKHSAKYGNLGVTLGCLCAFAGITLGLMQSTVSLGTAGLAYGCVAAFAGACYGLIGYFSTRETTF